MFADSAADEVGGGVCGPSDDQGEQEKFRPFRLNSHEVERRRREEKQPGGARSKRFRLQVEIPLTGDESIA